MNSENYSTWLEIDLGAIQDNINKIIQITKKPVMAIVKANGYGHGQAEVAKAAQEAGSSWIGVARLEEALALRNIGIRCQILVLGYTPPIDIPEALAEDIRLVVYDPEVAAAYSSQSELTGSRLKVHVKFDTGMGRLGAFPEDGVELIRWLNTQKGIEIEGVFTHLARADEPDLQTSDRQLDRFQTLIDNLQEVGLRPQWVHASNSAACFNFSQTHFDLVRPGIAIYGLHPSEKTLLPPGFKRALSWKTRLTSVKSLPKGHGISYGHHYITSHNEKIGVMPVGYADGFRRRLGNFALVHCQRVPVVGMVCMDQCMLQLDDVNNARIGDEVVLIGSQGEAVITAEEIAKEWGTINYELVCGMAARLPRIYFS